MKLLFGITGSVAAIKFNEIVEHLKKECLKRNITIDIKYIATEKAYGKFLKNCNEQILLDKDEWVWEKVGDVILHIDLRNWADMFVICPLDANTLASISNGIAANLLTCVCRSWNFEKTLLVFPCMNTYMYEHPITSKHIQTITSWGVKVIRPVEKYLACGEFGIGGLPSVDQVVATIIAHIDKDKK